MTTNILPSGALALFYDGVDEPTGKLWEDGDGTICFDMIENQSFVNAEDIPDIIEWLAGKYAENSK